MRTLAMLTPLLLLAAGVAMADTFTGCLTSSGKIVKVTIDVNPLQPCKANETQISWDNVGSAGPAGPRGPEGPAGKSGEIRIVITTFPLKITGLTTRSAICPTTHPKVILSLLGLREPLWKGVAYNTSSSDNHIIFTNDGSYSTASAFMRLIARQTPIPSGIRCELTTVVQRTGEPPRGQMETLRPPFSCVAICSN